MDHLAKLAKRHWKNHRPRMYQELKQDGTLDEAAKNASELTRDAISKQLENGVALDQAREALMQEWILLPSEDDMPNLGESPEGESGPE